MTPSRNHRVVQLLLRLSVLFLVIHSATCSLSLSSPAGAAATEVDNNSNNDNPSSTSHYQRSLQQIVTPFTIAGGIIRNYVLPKPLKRAWDFTFQTVGIQPKQRPYTISLATSGVSDSSPFLRSIDQWTNIITGDLGDVQTSGLDTDECGCIPCPINDLHICGQYREIDGTGGILGAAGPTRLRSSNNLPATGIMFFDSADIAASTSNITATILHEMGHVIGIGTLWSIKGLAGSSPTCSYSSSSQATKEYQTLSGCTTAVPIENDGGSGTACGHWDETCFETELMTGFSDTTNPLSRLTIGGVQDLGYTVSFSFADSGYTSADLASSCRCTTRRDRQLNLRGPDGTRITDIRSVGEDGRFRQRRRRLSEAGQSAALNYANDYLKSKELPEDAKKSGLDSNDQVWYIGDKVINILYEEDGEIYSILVDKFAEAATTVPP